MTKVTEKELLQTIAEAIGEEVTMTSGMRLKRAAEAALRAMTAAQDACDGGCPENECLSCAVDRITILERRLSAQDSVPVDRERLEQAHMAGQYNEGDGVDPSYSNAQRYVDGILSTEDKQ